MFDVTGQYTRTFSLGTLNCIDVLYCPPPIFLYIDHNHMDYLYNIKLYIYKWGY